MNGLFRPAQLMQLFRRETGPNGRQQDARQPAFNAFGGSLISERIKLRETKLSRIPAARPLKNRPASAAVVSEKPNKS